MEHSWKSILTDGDTVSVHRPGFYAERFKNFCFDRVFKRGGKTLGFWEIQWISKIDKFAIRS